jgi:hypothetical protein
MVGLALDPSGSFYSANLNGNTISKFDSAGNPVSFTLSGDSLNFPVDVAFAPALVSAAPEPGSLAFACLGVVVLGIVRRSRLSAQRK